MSVMYKCANYINRVSLILRSVNSRKRLRNSKRRKLLRTNVNAHVHMSRILINEIDTSRIARPQFTESSRVIACGPRDRYLK